ncbi:MAG TPA: hypothetical protein PK348_08850 [Spirochaetota bacterium]|nr:hypothetical protein [Spirochaetota bacterium]
MNASNKISLCQPAQGKGCCVCCGLFNCADISFAGLEHFLSDATAEIRYSLVTGNIVRNFELLQKQYTFRETTTYVCPYMGFIDSNTPGCLMHPAVNNGIDRRDCSLFGKEICNDYFCPAYTLLDDRLKKILVRYTDNWYTYSIGIIDPLSFIWIVQLIEDKLGEPIVPEKSTPDSIVVTLVNTSLMMVADFFNTVPVPVFYYSEPEYHLHMRELSLNQSSSLNAGVRDKIKNAISASLNGCS